MKNEAYWAEIEGQPPFAKEKNDHNYEQCWEWLEKFQAVAAPQLNSRGLILLDALLHSVYDAGKAAGEAEAGPVIPAGKMAELFMGRKSK